MIIHHLTLPHYLGGEDDSHGTGCRPSNPDPVSDPLSMARRYICADAQHAFDLGLAGRQVTTTYTHYYTLTQSTHGISPRYHIYWAPRMLVVELASVLNIRLIPRRQWV